MENAENGDLDLPTALQHIDHALSYDRPLRRRAEGVAWMMWGLVTATVLMAHDLAGIWTTRLGTLAVIVIGWPALGLFAAAAVWRLAGVPHPELTPRSLWIAAWAIIAAALVTVITVSSGLFFGATGHGVVRGLTMTALPWAILALAQWTRMTRGGRVAMVAAAVTMTVGFQLAFWLLPIERSVAPFATYAIIAGIPFTLGVVWVFRR